MTPNIINGFHISSYVFFSQDPKDFYCESQYLTQHTDWTKEQIRAVSTKNDTFSCDYYEFPYEKLAQGSFENALNYAKGQKDPKINSCLNNTNGDFEFRYEQEDGHSFIPEWNLVCDRKALVPNVQVALSIGKFIGASVFGIISDK